MILHLENIQIQNRIPKDSRLSLEGCIWLESEDLCFPGQGWFDRVSVLLEHWLPELLSFSCVHTDSCELVFMDGPYTMKLVRRNFNDVYAVFVEDGKILGEISVDYEKFLLSTAKAINGLATQVYRGDPENQYQNEIVQLGVYSKKLRGIARNVCKN